MTGVEDLAAWLVAPDGPIAADEQLARAAEQGPDGGGRWHAREGRKEEDDKTRRVLAYDGDDSQPAEYVLVEPNPSPVDEANLRHIANWDPARALAECAAKRAVVEAYLTAWPGDDVIGLERAVILLAQPYAGRRGWRTEWTTSAVPDVVPPGSHGG